MWYDIVLIGGAKDGEVIKSFDSYDEAYDFVTAYYKDHEDEFDPVCGGITIVNDKGVNIGW